MRSGKKISAILMAILVVAIVILSINIFINKIAGKSTEIEPSSEAPLSFLSSPSQEQPVENYKIADIQYDQNLYNTDIKSFESVILPYNLDPDKNYLPDTLFVGDSNTAGLFSFGYMPLQNVLAKPSMAIQAARTKEFVWFSGYSQPFTIVQSIPLLKPRRIIINFGTNNTVGTSVKDFKAIFKTTLDEITVAYPYSDIIIAAVLPVGRYRENTRIKMQTIDSFNIALAELCTEEGYSFLNTTETFKDPKTGFMKPNYVAKDGVHLNSVGYNALLEYITDHKLLTQDKRPPRGFIPKRVTTQTQNSAPPEFVEEPGEEVIFPPSAQSSSGATSSGNTSSGHTPSSSGGNTSNNSSDISSGNGANSETGGSSNTSEEVDPPQEQSSLSREASSKKSNNTLDPFL